jgi:hypothetical protein
MYFPSFDERLGFLNQFILDLVDRYQAGNLMSWDQLDKAVKTFFTSDCMDQIERLVPGWKKMASYTEGITLTHVMCVFLGVYMLPEFQALTIEGQQLEKWIVLFHDLDKFHIRGKKDPMHAFRSGVLAARILPSFGFEITKQYQEMINAWSELTLNAFITLDGNPAPKPDNSKLPEILSGIDLLFGEDTPAALITKVALLHISLNIDPFYPTPALLTEEETKRFIMPKVYPLLKVMMLGDNEGWTLFEPQARDRQSREAMAAFEKIERILASNPGAT